ncbi:ABC transporter permease [Bacillus sp. HMF5848]|uniref:ABC transporter permease subunit n=1 Tax=Bacillus sp. HMF5848 TaxID=2495421 RepID=UPI000F799A03|nr:ABC transporter permease subunit [Bacillus sp. HMF5848]RSK27935.1 ABC transporter permease [Bacillus sp. HMF5848]
MWTISKLTFREILSKRIFLITMIMTAVFIALYGTAIYFIVKETDGGMHGMRGMDAAMMQQFISSQLLGVGLYFSSFIIALLAILSSVSAVSSEVQSHQIDTWLMRSITRRDFVLGKAVGLNILMIIYAMGLFFSIIFVHQTIGGDGLDLQITAAQMLQAVSVFIIMPFILVSFGILLSTRMTTLNAGIVAIILYGASFIGGFVEQVGALLEKGAVTNIGIIMSLVFPVDSMYRKMTIFLLDSSSSPLSIAQGGIFTSVSMPSNVMVGYAVLYGVGAILLSIYSFRKRDV